MPASKKLTLEEFLCLRDGEKPALEFAHGEALRKPVPDQAHSKLQFFISLLLHQFLTQTGLGTVLLEFRCIFGPPGRERAFVPDAVFVAAGRLGSDDRYLHAAPDLAVEILSPDQPMARFADKIQFYLLHGVRLVWIIDPEDRSIAVLAPGQDAVVLASGDTLDGRDVVPGFQVPVDEIFASLQ